MTVEVTVNDKGEVIEKKLLLTEMYFSGTDKNDPIVQQVGTWKFPAPPATQVADIKVGLFFSDGEKGHNRISSE